jgi:hypothetical protein
MSIVLMFVELSMKILREQITALQNDKQEKARRADMFVELTPAVEDSGLPLSYQERGPGGEL